MYDKYFDLCESVKYICIVNTKGRIDELALEIYKCLKGNVKDTNNK